MPLTGPTPFFGGASIGTSFTTRQSLSTLLNTLKTLGISHIDTAARYPPTSPGASERLLGEVGAKEMGFEIDTKILVGGASDGSGAKGSLSRENIVSSLEGSLGKLGVGKVNTLYCHAPDLATPLLEQAAALNEQYRGGKFEKLGISNFQVPMLKEFLDICNEHGFVKPTVYQGQYNLLCRRPEKELIPFLRENGISFVAFSPLAGGFLTGRLTSGKAENTRLEAGNLGGNIFKTWYDKPAMHTAIHKIQKVVTKYDISISEAAVRWIFHHSVLKEEFGDGVILGASRVEQIEGNMTEVGRGVLPEEVVEVLEGVWEGGVKECAP